MTGAAILTEGLGKRFGDLVALADVDLEVPAGTVLGLLGPNGAGKTTTVRILTTILRPDSGRASVLGHDVAARPQTVRGLIGLAGQYAAVDGNLTGKENLALVGRLTHQPSSGIERRASELLERFGLSDAADRTVRTYSGGMRRRLDLAAALVHRPPVLFLDEPTTGLDPRGRRELWALIEELVGEGMSLLLTTQYLEEAEQLANHIVVIDGGRIIAEGTTGELKARLGATIIEVRMTHPADAAAARDRLAAIAPAEVDDGGRAVALTVHEAGRAVIEVVRALDASGLTPEWLTVREPTLDDVFLRLTGHKAEDGTDGAPAEGTSSSVAKGGRRSRRGAA